MALTTEDGTGKSNAESYCSVAQATAYHTGRSTAATWDNLDADVQESALRAATDYIQQMYAGMWSGQRKTDEQALDWPRTEAEREDSVSGYWLDNVVPYLLVNACADLALKAATAPLIVDLGRETVSESVDVVSVTYAKGGERQTQYEAADRWLRPLLNGGAGGSSIKVKRA
jgi:hypothetical protein